jgi:hypothetical protein
LRHPISGFDPEADFPAGLVRIALDLSDEALPLKN